MKTVALRFSDSLAPECGTINAHEEYIKKYGYVWYGKFGNTLSDAVISDVMAEEIKKILLIQSGTQKCYWAYIDDATKSRPTLEYVPDYYSNESDKVKVWFRVNKFEIAEDDIMNKCTVISANKELAQTIRHSMNSCFIIDYNGQ